MWMQPTSVTELQANYLSTLGRALALAQNFEANCKFALGIYDFGEVFTEKSGDLKTWEAFGKNLMRRSLGRAIKHREKDQSFKEQFATLEAARIARNYVAHQAAVPALYVPPLGGRHKLRDLLAKDVDRKKIERERQEMVIAHLNEMTPKLEKAVKDLAEGDSIVARWSYMIQEKDAFMPFAANDYVDSVVAWVMAPIHT